MIQWDTGAIFEQIGGPAALRRALAEDYEREAPAEATVAMWKSRNRIAAEWTAACIFAVIKRRGSAIHTLIMDVPDNPF